MSGPTLRVLLTEVKQARGLAAGAMLLALVAGALEVVTYALLLGALQALAAERTTPAIELLAGAGAVQTARSAVVYIGSRVAARLTKRVELKLRAVVAHEILGFSFAQIARYRTGDLSGRLLGSVQQVSGIVSTANGFVFNVVMGASYIVTMLVVAPALALGAIAIFGCAAVAYAVLLRKIQHESRVITTAKRRLADRVLEALATLRLVYVFADKERTEQKIDVLSRDIAAANLRLSAVAAALQPLAQVIVTIALGGLVALGIATNHEPAMVFLPRMLAFAVILRRLGGRLEGLVKTMSDYVATTGSRTELDSLLSGDGRIEERTGGEPIDGVKDAIVFDAVTMKYTAGERAAVSELSFEIPAGKTTALVGSSGCGKSTVVDLLIGLYEPTEGAIRVDGRELATIDLAGWRGLLGVVSQDVQLLGESIADNIRFGRPGATLDEVTTAARIADADAFIRAQEEGYETVLGNRGHGLSGGEQQRLALARAVVRQPQVLVLDEATSSLDSASERTFQETLARMHGSRTIVVIAHRLSTVVDADQILVFDEGRIEERGTHDELVAKNGRYAMFWRLQSRARASGTDVSGS